MNRNIERRSRPASRVEQAVIPLAGRGTRLLPATRSVPKGLLPLPGQDGRLQPVVQLLIDEVVDAGVRRLILVTPPRFREAFQHAIEPPDELDVILVDQTLPRGLGDAVQTAQPHLEEERFLLSLGDHVYRSHRERSCAGQLVDAASTRAGTWTAVGRIPASELATVAALVGDLLDDDPRRYRLRHLIEKPSLEVARRELRQPGLPEGTFLGHFGLHVFSPAIFEALERVAAETPPDREVELTSAQQILLRLEDAYLLEIDGERWDTGTPEAYLTTQIALGLAGPLGEQLRPALRKLLEERDAPGH